MSWRLMLCTLAFLGGCSQGGAPMSSVTPTAPSTAGRSLLGDTPVAPGGISGPMDAVFPGRNDAFDFSTQLDSKYQTGLGRTGSTSYVDREGAVVWVQEYIRYRANGCDHATAGQRVLAQVDGSVAGATCGAAPSGEVALPPRNETLDFGRQLDAKYQQMQRAPSTSFVDLEGLVIWLQEYLRYRLNSCDHATAVQKVFSQIDGNGIAATCFVPTACAYRLTPSGSDVSAAAGSHIVSLFAVPGGCTWTASSDSSWLTISAPTTGTGATQVTYNVTRNEGARRLGRVRFDWTGGTIFHFVDQAATPFNVQFQMFDPGRSTAATTECHIRIGSTPCNFTATANLTGTQTFAWTATYTYVTDKTRTQSGSSNTFSFTEGCGGLNSSSAGNEVPLNVTLTVTDTNGNSQTVRSGEGSLPALKLRLFTC